MALDKGVYRNIGGTPNVHILLGVGIAPPPPDLTPPTVPGNLRVTAVTATTITVAWDASTDTGGGTVARYEWSIDAGPLTSNGTALVHQFAGLGPSTAHVIAVRAVDDAIPGNASASTSIPVSTSTGTDNPPGAPLALHTTSVLSTSVSFAWSPTGDSDIGRYEYQIGDAANPWTNNMLLLSATASGLVAGTQNLPVRVRAVDQANQPGPAAVITVNLAGTPRTRPLLGMRASSANRDVRTAEVQALGGRIEGYRVFFSSGFGGFTGSNDFKDQVTESYQLGQYPVISVSHGTNPSWAQIASGAADSQLFAYRDYLATLASRGPCFASLQHECFQTGHPVTGQCGSYLDHNAANLHALAILKQAGPHVDVGLILNGWMFNTIGGLKQSDAELAVLISPALRQLCDVIACDPYQGSATAEDASTKMASLAAWAHRMGDVRGIGFAEWNGWPLNDGGNVSAINRPLAYLHDSGDPLLKWALLFNNPGSLGNVVLTGAALTAYQTALRDWHADGVPSPTFPIP